MVDASISPPVPGGSWVTATFNPPRTSPALSRTTPETVGDPGASGTTTVASPDLGPSPRDAACRGEPDGGGTWTLKSAAEPVHRNRAIPWSSVTSLAPPQFPPANSPPENSDPTAALVQGATVAPTTGR